ncbi:MAG: zf-HC2 domain-containing protein [Acetobacteraceae bacterium]|nr:zf-HC2 domain-containing protein [Acetobacteraceae bacterium]
MPTCREVAEQATEYLEEAMPRRERLGVWAHLRICPNCRAYLRQLMGTIALARRAGAGPPPPPQDEDRLVAAMKAARTPGAD